MGAERETRTGMPHYFFHLQCADQTIRDEHGDELADDHAALRRAVEAARTLLQGASEDDAWSRCFFEVADHAGETIWRMPVLDAVAIAGD